MMKSFRPDAGEEEGVGDDLRLCGLTDQPGAGDGDLLRGQRAAEQEGPEATRARSVHGKQRVRRRTRPASEVPAVAKKGSAKPRQSCGRRSEPLRSVAPANPRRRATFRRARTRTAREENRISHYRRNPPALIAQPAGCPESIRVACRAHARRQRTWPPHRRRSPHLHRRRRTRAPRDRRASQVPPSLRSAWPVSGRIAAGLNLVHGPRSDADELADVMRSVATAVWSHLPAYRGTALEAWAFSFCDHELRNAARRNAAATISLLPLDTEPFAASTDDISRMNCRISSSRLGAWDQDAIHARRL